MEGIGLFLSVYLIVALSVSITANLMLFRQAIDLLEELLEEKTFHSTIFGRLMWVFFGVLFAPYLILVLLNNDNDTFIRSLAVELLEKTDKDE